MKINKYNVNLMRLLAVFFSALLLTACQTKTPYLYDEGFPGTARWAVLPFVNHTESPGEITIQLERIMMVQLPSAGILAPRLYPESVVTTASDNLADAHRLQNGRQWASQSDISFAISGGVMEWGLDEDDRPFIAVNLEVFDVRTGEQLWTVSGSGEGLPGEDTYDVSRKLFSNLLASLPINRQR